jgi:2-hydroxyglutarate dehydrogenase
MYNYCEKFNIPHKRISKWIVSYSDEESEYLDKMKKKSEEIGQLLYFISAKEANLVEPNVKAKSVLVSPQTGIVNSHELMKCFQYEIEQNGGDIALESEVINIEKDQNSYIVSTKDFSIRSDTIINCAGLYSDKISEMVMGFSPKKIYYYKGQYFSYSERNYVNRLIYPVPPKNLESLGIHLTLDLSGQMKFGPDISYIGTEKNFDYSVSSDDIQKFHDSILSYLPNICKDKLSPSYSGIRPKLSPPGGAWEDFYIQEESKNGFPGFINLIGIESPGLTASISIAEQVSKLIGYQS